MLGDVSGAMSMKLIGDISETIEGKLNILIVEPLEAVEEIAKNIDSWVSLGWDTFINLRELAPD